MDALAFDASPLNHFALAGELDTLAVLVKGRRCVVTNAVRQELAVGAATMPELQRIEALTWLETVTVSTLDELYAFAQYMQRLGSTERNAGEATVLAWAEVHGAEAFVDDQAACNVARSRGVTVHRTLNLIVRAYVEGEFEEARARDLVQALVYTGARFPRLARDDVLDWARVEGLL